MHLPRMISFSDSTCSFLIASAELIWPSGNKKIPSWFKGFTRFKTQDESEKCAFRKLERRERRRNSGVRGLIRPHRRGRWKNPVKWNCCALLDPQWRPHPNAASIQSKYRAEKILDAHWGLNNWAHLKKRTPKIERGQICFLILI